MCSLCSALHVVICQELPTDSPVVTIPWDPGMQAPLTSRARQSKGIPWAAATKLRHQVCVKASLLEILALWSMGEEKCEEDTCQGGGKIKEEKRLVLKKKKKKRWHSTALSKQRENAKMAPTE